ncbi:MAG: MFS transporter [Chloroflexota bacterium]|nr:MFS transporter [Chloroflexota bacterium]
MIAIGLAFAFVGVQAILVPSLVPSIQSTFAQDDAGLGAYFLVASAGFAAGALLGRRLGRAIGVRADVVVGGALIATGLLSQGGAPGWPAFVAGGALAALGQALTQVGLNTLVMDRYPESRNRALALGHLAISLAAVLLPLAAAASVGAGVAWRTLFIGCAGAWLMITALLVKAVPASPRLTAPTGVDEQAETGSMRARVGPFLAVLAIATGCYVAAETGLLNWMVRYLDPLPAMVAGASLSLFWLGIVIGRIALARADPRIQPVRTATTLAVVGGVLVAVAVLAPAPIISLAMFGAAGAVLGPIYPLILAAAGDRLPGQSAFAVGTLTLAGVVGAIIYPPVVGLLSAAVTLQVALLGTVALLVTTAVALAFSRIVDTWSAPASSLGR